jgi:hypothetical protein
MPTATIAARAMVPSSSSSSAVSSSSSSSSSSRKTAAKASSRARVTSRGARGAAVVTRAGRVQRMGGGYLAPMNAKAHGPRFHEYGGFDIDPELQHNRVAYIRERCDVVTKEFPNAVGMDDFLFRTEVMLRRFGFTADNSIALTSLCRDEITFPLKNAIHDIFGYSLDVDGLGGVITAGTTGLAAGLSHSPTDYATGKERYVLFALPHIAIDAEGRVGSILRAGRQGQSCACGALVKMQPMFKQFKEGKLDMKMEECAHDPLDPEFSILTRRMMTAVEKDKIPNGGLPLVEVTRLADRVIRSDLDKLIQKTVDVSKADYAVVTGIQIHSTTATNRTWHPNLEFISPTSMYVVKDGVRHDMDVLAIDPPTPRQLFHIAGGDEIFDLPLPRRSWPGL